MFLQTFYAKSSVCYPSLLPLSAATPSEIGALAVRLHSAAFPQETGAGAAVFRHDPLP